MSTRPSVSLFLEAYESERSPSSQLDPTGIDRAIGIGTVQVDVLKAAEGTLENDVQPDDIREAGGRDRG